MDRITMHSITNILYERIWLGNTNTFKRLERSEANVSRYVLRGLGPGNRVWLLDFGTIAKISVVH